MSPQKIDVSVRFTETFLRGCERVPKDDELKLLARVLAENPTCGKPAERSSNLRSLAWTQGSTDFRVWYLHYPETPHIEVVAVTRPDEVAADAASTRRAIWWILRIGFALRIANRTFRFVHDHIDWLQQLGIM